MENGIQKILLNKYKPKPNILILGFDAFFNVITKLPNKIKIVPIQSKNIIIVIFFHSQNI